MAEFHFLRPWWLLLLPLALWAAWRLGTGRGGSSGWRAVVDLALQPFVLSEGETVGQRRWPLFAALAAAVVASVALAGPTWERLPVPAYRSDEALVVAFDLSRSMDATDIEPSRVARARLKLLDLLERRTGGQTALVVFSSNAFTVTPLTSDTRTIASLVNALSTDIMPSRGSLLEVGLGKAAELLRQTGMTRGEILLITDATAGSPAFELAGSLRQDQISTSVLAVGTEEGAPIPVLNGGFVTDNRGQVVVPQVNLDNLERLARAGGGRFARLTVGDSDLERLFPDAGVGDLAEEQSEEQREADIWRDQGVWLCLALVPLVALGFRRGWVYVFVAGLVFHAPSARALDWSDLWLTGDQQGFRALQTDRPEEASALFTDPEWLAAAHYRARQYEASAAALAGIDTAEANYNRGNALARAGRLAEAIAAYDRALELEPGLSDAEFNRELVEELLEQQPPDSQSRPDQPDDSGEAGDAGSETEERQGQDSSEGASGEGDEEQEQQATDQREGNADSSAESPDSESERGEPREPEAGSQPETQSAQVSPEDVEDWASEQAAEQWLRRIPQDPGGLLRRKFLYQYQQLGLDQDGNRIFPGNEAEPW